MLMLSFIFVIVCGLFDWKQICAGILYLNSDRKQFHQYQQNKQSPLVFTLNKTSNHLLPSHTEKRGQ
jgi:hypothetical protein